MRTARVRPSAHEGAVKGLPPSSVEKAAAMTPVAPIDRARIAAEFAKDCDDERSLMAEAGARAESPPDPTLGVVYHEIAAADERHAAIVETIAIRYGHTPSRAVAGGIGETLGRLKEKVGEIG